MSEIGSLLRSPVFWLVTVLLSLVLNVGAAYLKNWLDRNWLKGRTILSERSKAAKSARDRRVSSMAENLNRLHHATNLMHDLRFLSLFFLLLAVALNDGAALGTSAPPLSIALRILAGISFTLACFAASMTVKYAQELSDAYKLRDLVRED